MTGTASEHPSPMVDGVGLFCETTTIGKTTRRRIVMPRIPLTMRWTITSLSGWGINGLNLALSLLKAERFLPMTTFPVDRPNLILTPLESRILEPFFVASRDLLAQLEECRGASVRSLSPMLDALGNDFIGSSQHSGVSLRGAPMIGVCYLEDARVSKNGLERARKYDAIVAGSSYVERIISAQGIGPVKTVLQGIDPTLMHPGPKAGWFRDRFVVFSGGKAELRKGQDLVLLAFRSFAARHPEALLLTAWHSPWPDLAASLASNPAVTPMRFRPDGSLDVVAWAADNGVSPKQVLDVGLIPNTDVPRVLREADVAVFPNRCEGGTNLVAMECMACGVPTILSANSGHLDVIRDGACLPLRRQRPIVITEGSAEGWGDSDVEEIDAALEIIWTDRQKAQTIGAAGAAFMSELTWDSYAKGITDLIASVS